MMQHYWVPVDSDKSPLPAHPPLSKILDKFRNPSEAIQNYLPASGRLFSTADESLWATVMVDALG